MVLFDCFFQTILKEVEYQFRDIRTVYRIKEDKFFLHNSEEEIFLLELEKLTTSGEEISKDATLGTSNINI